MVEFDELVKAASEIATAKENCAEAVNTCVRHVRRGEIQVKTVL